jgi:hypothetical protein
MTDDALDERFCQSTSAGPGARRSMNAEFGSRPVSSDERPGNGGWNTAAVRLQWCLSDPAGMTRGQEPGKEKPGHANGRTWHAISEVNPACMARGVQAGCGERSAHSEEVKVLPHWSTWTLRSIPSHRKTPPGKRQFRAEIPEGRHRRGLKSRLSFYLNIFLSRCGF